VGGTEGGLHYPVCGGTAGHAPAGVSAPRTTKRGPVDFAVGRYAGRKLLWLGHAYSVHLCEASAKLLKASGGTGGLAGAVSAFSRVSGDPVAASFSMTQLMRGQS
jgi:hypothetical protein